MMNNILYRESDLNEALRNRMEERAQLILDLGVQPSARSLKIVLENSMGNIAERILDSGVQPSLGSLKIALENSMGNIAESILDSCVQPSLGSLKIALKNTMDNIAERILQLNVQPDLGCFHTALLHNSKVEIIEKILESDVKPTEISLNCALDRNRFEIAQKIINLGVRPTVDNLNEVLSEGGKVEIVRQILKKMKDKPNALSFENSLERGMFEIAEEILERNEQLQPNENNPSVRDFMNHKRSMQNLKDLAEDPNLIALSSRRGSSKLSDTRIEKTKKLNEKLRALDIVLKRHAPLKNRQTKIR